MNLEAGITWMQAVQTTRQNIITRLEEEICTQGGCLDPYCKAMVEAVEIIKGNRDYPEDEE